MANIGASLQADFCRISHWPGDLAQDIIDNPGESNYYVGGFRRLSEPTPRQFIVTAAIAYWVLDEVFEVLLSDARLLRQVDCVREALDEVVSYVADNNIGVWELLASICGGEISDRQFRSDAIAASHIAQVFFSGFGHCEESMRFLCPWPSVALTIT
jgi:hypothetical protein